MKKYNVDNYVRYKNEVQELVYKLPKIEGDYTILSNEQMVHCFLPLVENVARKFSTSQQASGVMTIMDLTKKKLLNHFYLNELKVLYVEL